LTVDSTEDGRTWREKGTRIHVLTGGPCSGKTTLLDELARRGFPVIPEAARVVIQEGRWTPASHPLEFQREVLRLQIEWERAAPPGVVFADRGIGDHFGYIEYYRSVRGIDILADFTGQLAGAWEEARARYGAIFLLDQAETYTPAAYRRESEAEAVAVHRALSGAYRSRHARVIEVPWGPVGERVERVLAAVEPQSPMS
jgi:predicted ATPase